MMDLLRSMEGDTERRLTEVSRKELTPSYPKQKKYVLRLYVINMGNVKSHSLERAMQIVNLPAEKELRS